MATLALCPSRGRPDAARETLASFEATRQDPDSRIVFIVDEDDPTIEAYPADYVYRVAPTGRMGGALDAAARDRELLGQATSVGMIGDDNRFRTPGWDRVIDGWLTEAPGIAYGDDGFQHERLPTSWWVSRPIVDIFGMAPRELRHLYMDNYWLELGQAASCLRYFPEISIEHLHPLAGKAEDDATYRRGNSASNARNDRAWFHHWRRSARFDRDVRRIRALVEEQRPRRVLADWHHPALWESLSILFEDRFGWELYSPLGLDWTDHGWRFDTLDTIGWSAADYLAFEDARPVRDHFERIEPEYPARPRKLVTWEQAEAQEWDFVLASVSTHQRSFAALARELDGRFIHQVGNARHHIERRIPQVVLASATIPLRDRRGLDVVTYHQEFDTSLFAPVGGADPLAVTAFMLRLDWTSCAYAWMAEAPGIRWSVAGGADPRDPGYLAPMGRVAERMAGSGWIWHDKRIGDGYGHVIHNAAAMGRPLIGHASHYAGLLGEPLWRDLDTCIDLDRHEPRDVLRLIRAIAADPDWYRDISERTSANFRRLVDFDAEANEILAALL